MRRLRSINPTRRRSGARSNGAAGAQEIRAGGDCVLFGRAQPAQAELAEARSPTPGLRHATWDYGAPGSPKGTFTGFVIGCGMPPRSGLRFAVQVTRCA